MSLATLSRRMEIAFWTSWVSTLRLLRVARWLPALLVGFTCLSSLLLTTIFASAQAKAAGQAGRLAPNNRTGRSVAAPTLPDHSQASQQNILLMIVNRLEGRPTSLQGVWLLVSDPEYQNITFLPIYPNAPAGKAAASPDLSRVFRIDAAGEPAEAFLEAVRQKDIWWDHYLILDHGSLAALVELAGGVGLGNGLLHGGEAVSWLTVPGQTVEMTLERQATLLEAVCLQSARLVQTAHPDLMAGLLAGSGRSDLTVPAFRSGWEQLDQAENINCEFPTILGRR